MANMDQEVAIEKLNKADRSWGRRVILNSTLLPLAVYYTICHGYLEKKEKFIKTKLHTEEGAESKIENVESGGKWKGIFLNRGQNEKRRTSTRTKTWGRENATETKEALKTVTTFMDVKKRNQGRNVIKHN